MVDKAARLGGFCGALWVLTQPKRVDAAYCEMAVLVSSSDWVKAAKSDIAPRTRRERRSGLAADNGHTAAQQSHLQMDSVL